VDSCEVTLEHAGDAWNTGIMVTRGEFEEMAGDIFKRLISKVREALSQAHCDPKQIDGLLLFGGSALIPKIRQMLEQLTGKTAYQKLDCREAVIRGITIYGPRCP
jgi:molecular chaperone DnaK (HSP70)